MCKIAKDKLQRTMTSFNIFATEKSIVEVCSISKYITNLICFTSHLKKHIILRIFKNNYIQDNSIEDKWIELCEL